MTRKPKPTIRELEEILSDPTDRTVPIQPDGQLYVVEAREELLIDAVHCFHWMARRYADGRSSYAPGVFNGHTRKLLAAGFGLKLPYFARDGMGRSFDGLTEAEVAEAAEDMPRGFIPDGDERLRDALESVAKLQAFKDYVHQRLDEAGIPTHPEGPHSAAGCRVGDRLDLALNCTKHAVSQEPE